MRLYTIILPPHPTGTPHRPHLCLLKGIMDEFYRFP